MKPEDVVLAVGNCRKLREIPLGCREGHEASAFVGGFRLWENADSRNQRAPAGARPRGGQAKRRGAL